MTAKKRINYESSVPDPVSEVLKKVKETDIDRAVLEDLEAALRIQREFIANASHELRTPLTVITGQIEVGLLQERTAEEYRKVLVSVLEDIKSLNTLTNRLLILLRADSVSNDIEEELIRIDDLLWKAQSMLLKKNADYTINISFDASIGGEHHFRVKGNNELLQSAFINLIENACKYSHNKQVNIVLSVNDLTLDILFIDEGIGIPAHEIDEIFQPFYRASNTTSNVKGYGIGLSIVKKIMAIHKGSIEISSEISKGTKVCLSFPLMDK